jgi:hypothetical protein
LLVLITRDMRTQRAPLADLTREYMLTRRYPLADLTREYILTQRAPLADLTREYMLTQRAPLASLLAPIKSALLKLAPADEVSAPPSRKHRRGQL